MEETTKKEGKSCYCASVIGVLVIALAWWQPSWSPIALTVLGVALIVRDIMGKCCCASICKPKV